MGSNPTSDTFCTFFSGEASLEQVLECQLFGNVTSMAATRLAKADKDALLLAFGDAKVGGHLFTE